MNLKVTADKVKVNSVATVSLFVMFSSHTAGIEILYIPNFMNLVANFTLLEVIRLFNWNSYILNKWFMLLKHKTFFSK